MSTTKTKVEITDTKWKLVVDALNNTAPLSWYAANGLIDIYQSNHGSSIDFTKLVPSDYVTIGGIFKSTNTEANKNVFIRARSVDTTQLWYAPFGASEDGISIEELDSNLNNLTDAYTLLRQELTNLENIKVKKVLVNTKVEDGVMFEADPSAATYAFVTNSEFNKFKDNILTGNSFIATKVDIFNFRNTIDTHYVSKEALCEQLALLSDTSLDPVVFDGISSLLYDTNTSQVISHLAYWDTEKMTVYTEPPQSAYITGIKYSGIHTLDYTLKDVLTDGTIENTHKGWDIVINSDTDTTCTRIQLSDTPSPVRKYTYFEADETQFTNLGITAIDGITFSCKFTVKDISLPFTFFELVPEASRLTNGISLIATTEGLLFRIASTIDPYTNTLIPIDELDIKFDTTEFNITSALNKTRILTLSFNPNQQNITLMVDGKVIAIKDYNPTAFATYALLDTKYINNKLFNVIHALGSIDIDIYDTALYNKSMNVNELFKLHGYQHHVCEEFNTSNVDKAFLYYTKRPLHELGSGGSTTIDTSNLVTKDAFNLFKSKVANDYTSKVVFNEHVNTFSNYILETNAKLSKFLTVTELNNKYYSKTDSDLRYATKSELGDINNNLAMNYLTSANIASTYLTITALPTALDPYMRTDTANNTFHTKSYIEETFLKKSELGSIDLSNYAKLDQVYTKDQSDARYVQPDVLKVYAKKSEIEGFVNNETLTNAITEAKEELTTDLLSKASASTIYATNAKLTNDYHTALHVDNTFATKTELADVSAGTIDYTEVDNRINTALTAIEQSVPGSSLFYSKSISNEVWNGETIILHPDSVDQEIEIVLYGRYANATDDDRNSGMFVSFYDAGGNLIDFDSNHATWLYFKNTVSVNNAALASKMELVFEGYGKGIFNLRSDRDRFGISYGTYINNPTWFGSMESIVWIDRSKPAIASMKIEFLNRKLGTPPTTPVDVSIKCYRKTVSTGSYCTKEESEVHVNNAVATANINQVPTLVRDELAKLGGSVPGSSLAYTLDINNEVIGNRYWDITLDGDGLDQDLYMETYFTVWPGRSFLIAELYNSNGDLVSNTGSHTWMHHLNKYSSKVYNYNHLYIGQNGLSCSHLTLKSGLPNRGVQTDLAYNWQNDNGKCACNVQLNNTSHPITKMRLKLDPDYIDDTNPATIKIRIYRKLPALGAYMNIAETVNPSTPIDLNTYVTTGVFMLEGTFTNVPILDPVIEACRVDVSTSKTGRIMQRLITTDRNDFQELIRIKKSDTDIFSTWVNI